MNQNTKKTIETPNPLSIKISINGHGTTKNIVAVDVKPWGEATIFIRENGIVRRENRKFNPFLFVSDERLLKYLGKEQFRELSGELPFKYRVNLKTYKDTVAAVTKAFNEINKKSVEKLKELKEGVWQCNPTEQFLLDTGETLFKGMKYSDVMRMQMDIETTGLNPDTDKIFAITCRFSDGFEKVIHGEDERCLLVELTALIKAKDPDIIENHNIFHFDLPFLIERFRHHRLSIKLSRSDDDFSSFNDSFKVGENTEAFVRYVLVGRHIIDTLHSVKRFDAITRKLGGVYKLKEVSKVLGFGRFGDSMIDGEKIYETYKLDRQKFMRYVFADVHEVDEISKLIHQDKFALAQIVPMSYERIATSGSTKLVELPIVREYLKAGHSLPAPLAKTKSFRGADVRLHRKGVFLNCGKADVKSMYPSIVLNSKISPHKDPLGIYLQLLKLLTEMRLEFKAHGKNDPVAEATSGAYKIVINSAYGYLGSPLGMFNNPEGAAKVTEIGREILANIERLIINNGGVLLESDTDGVIYQLPTDKQQDEVITFINDGLQQFPGITVEAESSVPWQSIYVYKSKSYAVLQNGKVKITGGAFKSKAIPPILKQAISDGLYAILTGDPQLFYEIFESVRKKLFNGKVNVADIAIKKTIKDSVKKYQDDRSKNTRKASQPEYEVLINRGDLTAPAGTTLLMFKGSQGYGHASDFDGNIDVKYYKKMLDTKLSIFNAAFSKDDWVLINSAGGNCEKMKFIGNLAEMPTEIPYINVVTNIKIENSFVSRKKFVAVDDVVELKNVILKANGIDCYYSPWPYHMTKRPTEAKSKQLAYAKMSGDFWCEAEGSFESPEKFNNAAKLAIEIKEILFREFKIPREEIVIYFNGGKSFYVRCSGNYFISEPTPCLNAKYLSLAEFIKSQITENLQNQVDLNIYSVTQLMRIPGTLYPDGGAMIEVPQSHHQCDNWQLRLNEVHQDVSDEDISIYLPCHASAEALSYSLNRFDEITKERNRHKEYRAKKRNQKDINRAIETLIAKNVDKFPPCLRLLMEAAGAGESIGWAGRVKLIYEASRCGFSEDDICRIFIMNGSATRYGVLELDTIGTITTCGYRLKESYKVSNFADVGCDKPELGPFCNFRACYRSELDQQLTEIDLNEKAPNFADFQHDTKLFLEEFFK